MTAYSDLLGVTGDFSISGKLTTNGVLLRAIAITSSSNLTAINSDDGDFFTITLSEDTTFQNPTGTPSNIQLLQIRITSSTSRAIAFGIDYQAASGLALPTATTGGGAEDYIAFRWNSTDSKWDMVGITIGALADPQLSLDSISTTVGSTLYRNSSDWVAVPINDGWVTVRKTSDEGRTSTTTNSADSELLTPTLLADKTYLLEVILVVTGTSAAGGIKVQWDIPAGASIAGTWIQSTATAGVNQPTNTSVTISTAANQDPLQIHRYIGAILVAGTAGTVTLSWSQVSSSASTVTIKAGSELKYKLGN